ncbi:iron-sulfur cluster assembly scaffold protein [Candidatus Oscillochloris fontis]|uniref:iron-sulfur cluster assembly scaffold protein n=1 Tax=Candidatus Oscillochloris fontis TaxID=2496868 RepID=UPI00101BD07B|nr:iron-sulfur cluster assembly scaffold protein [Candidatus Oscillochloris fontis]
MDRQQIIERLFDHYEHPRHSGRLEDADLVHSGGNPDCGDLLTFYLKIDPATERIIGLSFEGRGCTISQAGASILCEYLQDEFLITIESMDDEDVFEMLGREVVRSRQRCSTLALNTLKVAIMRYRAGR